MLPRRRYSRRLISSIGFLRTELSKLGSSQPLCAWLKGYHPEGAADRLLHCGISAPPPTGYGRDGSSTERLKVSISRLLSRKRTLPRRPVAALAFIEAAGHPPGRAVRRCAPLYSMTFVCAQQHRWRYRKAERLRFDGM